MDDVRQADFPTGLTTAAFLDWLIARGGRGYQLVDGAARAISPATTTHGLIQVRLGGMIDRWLAESGSPYWAATEVGIVPPLFASRNVRVADIGVTAAPVSAEMTTMPEPVLLIEILSPGNEEDTRANAVAYATIPSMREIVLLRSTRIAAEVLRRGADGAWPNDPEEPSGAVAALRLDSIGFACTLSAIYAGTHLHPARAR